MYVHGMRYLLVYELDGYQSCISEDFGIFFEMSSRVIRFNFIRESSLKGTPLDWALANVFEDLDFLLHYRAANRIKPLVARSTKGIVI